MCGDYIGEQIESGRICGKCLSSLPRTEQDMLSGNITELTLLKDKPTISEARKYYRLERAAAFLFYEKEQLIQQVIHKMKYSDQPMIGYQLGRQAALEFQYSDFFDGIDIIVPMPLHPKRFRERGYNQSEYIARGINAITGIPIDTTHVIRKKNTPKQALQEGDERKSNVKDAFAVCHPEDMCLKHILLVDDLITTGETVKSCLHAMKMFKCARFSVFALCKTK